MQMGFEASKLREERLRLPVTYEFNTAWSEPNADIYAVIVVIIITVVDVALVGTAFLRVISAAVAGIGLIPALVAVQHIQILLGPPPGRGRAAAWTLATPEVNIVRVVRIRLLARYLGADVVFAMRTRALCL